jgi:cell division protease FtsH
MARKAPKKAGLLTRLKKHFGSDPTKNQVVQQHLDFHERPNLHLAIEELLGEKGRQPQLIGVVVPEEYHSVTLSKLSTEAASKWFLEGPVEYVDVEVGKGRRLACVKRGLYLFRDQGRPTALLVTEEMHSRQPGLIVEVMTADRGAAEEFQRKLVRRTREGKAYRGQVLSLELDCFRQLAVRFHSLPEIQRTQLILPENLLARIERHTLGFTRQAARLKAAGRHLKRGVLLHGPPGTGKTLTAMYLATQMVGRTVLLLTGGGMNAIETAAQLARLLEPATLILEDVDLIGTERNHQTVGANALLFELLNQMDGLSDDADLLFILTTNRPDVLEPALASRPGRIDQAFEVPLPDADCRSRLLKLYGDGLHLELKDPDALVRKTEGASGAFIRELLRKASLISSESEPGDRLVVRDRHLEEALGELLVAGGPITQSLLGAKVGSGPKA